MRPRDLAQLLLSSGELLPRPRLRNQSPDFAGLELKRRLLQRITEIDPESDQLDATLASLIEELGPPSGPIRALAVSFRDEWQGLASNPDWLKQLSDEAAQETERKSGGGRQVHE
jgi:hypothetical protein